MYQEKNYSTMASVEVDEKEELNKIKLKSLTKEEVEEQRRSAYEYKF